MSTPSEADRESQGVCGKGLPTYMAKAVVLFSSSNPAETHRCRGAFRDIKTAADLPTGELAFPH